MQIEYSQVAKDLSAYTDILLKTIRKEQQKLKDLQDKQETYIREQQRKEEMLAEKDYYRLNLSSEDEQDIAMLRNL